VRYVSGNFALAVDFDISQFPVTEATFTIEHRDGTKIVIQNATCRASVEDDKIVVHFEGMADDEAANLIEAWPRADEQHQAG
jgi:hypothetical protein